MTSQRAVLNPGGGSQRRSPQRTLDAGLSSRAAGWGQGVPGLPPTSDDWALILAVGIYPARIVDVIDQGIAPIASRLL